MAYSYDDRHHGEYRGGRGYDREHRNFVERAGDEVRSWFGGERGDRDRPDRWRGSEWRTDEDRWRADYGRGDYERADYDRAPRNEDWRWRSTGESRGIYEDDSGQVHRFTHWTQQNFAGRGPKGYRRSDDRIREDVCDRLTDDARVDASEMEVSVQNGEVMLSGAVHSREEKRRAEDLVERVAGVRDVHNNLRVTPS